MTIENRFVPNDAVSLYFKAADLLVLPYRSATQSGVIQVAYNFGVPVVSTRVGGLPEVVLEGETGFLVPPENPRQLADAVIKYFKQGQKDTIVKGIEKVREKFSWDTMVTTLTQLTVK